MSPRLNGIVKRFEEGKHAFCSFASPDIKTAITMSTTKYDGVVFEMEHNPWNPSELRDAFQYMLNRGQIAKSGSVAPQVTPLVRIPPNGSELAQWHAKQALDLGAYGIVWPHVDSVEEAYNAVAACRYPRLSTEDMYEPAGLRGDGPTAACRYWGISNQEYYKKADTWPLAPEGEILVVLMMEGTKGIYDLDNILKEVPGIGMILIGEGDLSQELGHPREYEHPVVMDHKKKVLETCAKYNVPVGHPHVNAKNIQSVLDDGYRFLMVGGTTSYAGLEKGFEITGRE